ncbi:MAG: fused MFS/spermidine synthase [Nitrospinae bacterium]|nr:fused MFS/spermidine synthase [Nitrospinota bacterium]
MKRAFLFGLFFISGSAGLIYEIVWVRELTLLLGVSIYAVSAVLVAFMGGLGFGAVYFGKKLDRGLAPIRLYAALEMAIAVYVLLFPFILQGLERAYVLLHPGDGGNPLYVMALRFVLAISALLIPTALMGGTLPALSRYLAQSGRGIGKSVGSLYAVNTLGAVVGCVLAGFWLIEHIGLSGSLRVGAVMNIVCGIGAFLLAAEAGWASVPASEVKAASTSADDFVLPRKSILFLFGVSGFCAMALEVLWTRMFILLLNNTTYAFSLILAIFLLGIGTGSALTARMMKKAPRNGAFLFGGFQMGIGLFALVSLAGLLFNRELIGLVGAAGSGFLASVIPGGNPMAEAVIFSMIIVFPATFLMGGGFPLILGAIFSVPEKTGGMVGRFYAMNIAGCVLGSLAAGYLFIPLLGIRAGIVTVSWIAIFAGVYLQIKSTDRKERSRAVFAVVCLLAITIGVVAAGDTAYALSAQKLEAGSRVKYYREGPSATVLVSSLDSDLSVNRKPVTRIWINGDPIAGAFREALQLERLQAHIPLMMHPSPKKALVICFGTGSTAGAAAAHGLQRVTAVDISREVFGAADKFAEANFNVARNPSFSMVEEDGRNFLLTTQETFDLITSEPPPPSNAGIVSLYTREYYLLCKKRLAEKGIVSQWIPLHHLSEEDFRALVATFVDVFPNATMWYTKWDAIMIGSNAGVPLDFSGFQDGMMNGAVAESLKGIGIVNPYQLLSNFMMDSENIRRFAAGAAPVTDDRPYIEFSAPRIHETGVAIKGRNLENLLKYRGLPKAVFASAEQEKVFQGYFRSEEEFLRGQIEQSDGHFGAAAKRFSRALEINPDNPDARYAHLSLNITTLYSALSKNQPDMGLQLLADTERMDTGGLFRVQTHFLKGMFLAGRGSSYEAEREFLEALKLDPQYMMAAVNLAGLYGFVLKNEIKAKEYYNYALTLDPSESERQAILEALGKLT